MDKNYIKFTCLGLLMIASTFFSDLRSLLIKAAIAIAIYFGGISFYVLTVAGLTVVDVITGVWAAKKRNEEITSRKLRKGLLEKTALYIILLISAFALGKLLQSVLHYETFYITWSISVIISVYEITSIIENIIKIYPELSYLNRIKLLLNKVANKQIDNVENKLSELPLDNKVDTNKTIT